MSKGTILVVEPDNDIRNMLNIYFDGQGYIVNILADGASAIREIEASSLPDAIILDFNLPDMNSYEVLQAWGISRKRVPIIFLCNKEDYPSDIIGERLLNADDYMSKPIDVLELKYRVEQLIEYYNRTPLISPVSGLPMGYLTESRLRDLIRKRQDWSYIDIKINDYENFKTLYGQDLAEEVVKASALMVVDAVDKHGTVEDFVGHVGAAYFVVMSYSKQVNSFIEYLEVNLNTEIGKFLNPEQAKLITLSYGLVDISKIVVMNRLDLDIIREITELATEDRHKRLGKEK
jgi:DNA-binding response OmpR family regulator